MFKPAMLMAISLSMLSACSSNNSDPDSSEADNTPANESADNTTDDTVIVTPGVAGEIEEPVTSEPMGEAPVIDGNGGGNAPSSDTSAIAGLWDASFAKGTDFENTLYVRIGSEADWTTIDYKGDPAATVAGNETNCYTSLETNVFSLGGTLYQVGYTRTVEEIEQGVASAILLNIVKSDEGLTISGEDTIDWNGNGDLTENLNELWPMVSEIDPEFGECLSE